MFRFKLFALQFTLTLALRAQIVPGQFIVELTGDPAIGAAVVADRAISIADVRSR